VVVLYGTDRRGEQVTAGAGTRMSFSAERGAETTLGRAVVSIPSEKRRPKGTWSRPELDFVVWRIQRAESMDRDVTLLGVEQLSPDAFLTSARRELGGRPRAFVFVHGYNVSFDDAIFRTAQIAHDTGFDGLAFAYSWPSKGGVFDYNTDSENASFAAGRLQDFLEMVATGTGASEVHLVAHSMGSKALLLALDRLAQKRPGYRFGEIILAAPDLLRGPFLDLVRTARPLARGITLYASDNDRALRLSGLNRPNEWPVGLIRNGPPVVAEGVQSIDVSRLNTGGLSFNHSTFAEREPLIVDMAALFGGGARYPHERSPNFERVAPTGAGAPWWRYSGPATTQPRR
jgi:esterase/lipase superfamily enzyme